MEQLEKTSMPAYKTCSKCGGHKPIAEFFRDVTAGDGLHSSCKGCARLFNQSARGKEILKHYKQSAKGKEATRRCAQVPRAKLLHQMSNYRYNASALGMATNHKRNEYYTRSGLAAIWQRERYHQIQDEAGCHRKPESFYLGYRFLQALETAEVVEIKL